MRKFVATAAVAASAAATLVLTPLAAHAASPGPDGTLNGEIRTGCQNGVTGYYIAPDNTSHQFALVPGSEVDTGANGPGVWQFFINQPTSLESYGPALGSDKSGGWETQRVEKAVVNLDGGREMTFFNDKANGFQFRAVDSFHLFYQCGVGKG